MKGEPHSLTPVKIYHLRVSFTELGKQQWWWENYHNVNNVKSLWIIEIIILFLCFDETCIHLYPSINQRSYI